MFRYWWFCVCVDSIGLDFIVLHFRGGFMRENRLYDFNVP